MNPISKQSIILRLVENPSITFLQQNDSFDQRSSYDEKFQTLFSLLSENLPNFLEKYGIYLSVAELDYFFDTNESQEVQWIISNLLRERKNSNLTKEEKDQKKRETEIKNRRYLYYSSNLQYSPFFSLEEIKIRDPVSFSQLYPENVIDNHNNQDNQTDIGQLDPYLLSNCLSDNFVYFDRLKTERETEQEWEEEEEEEEEGSEESDTILENNNKVEKKRFEIQNNKNKEEEDNISEHDSDDDKLGEEEELEDWDEKLNEIDKKMEEEKEKWDEREKKLKKKMYKRYLRGDDKDWIDYSEIDDDQSIDEREREREREDMYFDDE